MEKPNIDFKFLEEVAIKLSYLDKNIFDYDGFFTQQDKKDLIQNFLSDTRLLIGNTPTLDSKISSITTPFGALEIKNSITGFSYLQSKADERIIIRLDYPLELTLGK